MADLLYALGWALWTGVVVVVFVQIYPEAKKRQYKRALDAYEAAPEAQKRHYKQALDAFEAAVSDQAQARSGQAPDPGVR